VTPLQNRVTPFGEIIATPARGLFTGNRGIIHDPESRTLRRRRWTSPAWLICLCAYKGRRRVVMGPGSWTALFFLDEATALAAGHRPCFECRRGDAEAFRRAWAVGRATPLPRAPDIDAILHAERLLGRGKRLHPIEGSVGDLPDGAMIAGGGDAFLAAPGGIFRWSPGGYAPAEAPPDARLLTPPSTLAALRSGYRPVLHPSALG